MSINNNNFSIISYDRHFNGCMIITTLEDFIDHFIIVCISYCPFEKYGCSFNRGTCYDLNNHLEICDL